jgi:hypothetical protein
MARWDEYFAKSYGTGGIAEGMKMGFDKWKQENDPSTKALLQLKIDSEARRAREGAVRTDLLQKKQAIIESIMGGGQGGAPMGGGNFPAGTTFSIGGLNMPLNRKYTGEESAKLSQSGAILKDLTDMKTYYESGKSMKGAEATAALRGLPLGAGSLAFGMAGLGKGGLARQDFTDLQYNVSERLLRLRSGAQINEKEYQRFRKMMPSLFRNNKLDVKQLDRFISEFSALEGRIQSGAMWDKKAGKFVGGEEPKSVNLDTLFSDLETPAEESE